VGGAAINVPPSNRLSFAERTKQNLEAPQGEERYGWLINIKDEHGNSPDSPHYDPSTLYIPPLAYNALKPFEQQFWDVKKVIVALEFVPEWRRVTHTRYLSS